MQKTFNVYSDPGHGWARVPLTVLHYLGIENDITSYSYQRGLYAYLEEDCDLSLFIKAFRERTGSNPVFRETSTDRYSKIRGYSQYRAPKPPTQNQ